LEARLNECLKHFEKHPEQLKKHVQNESREENGHYVLEGKSFNHPIKF
jgi:hypothetical protein